MMESWFQNSFNLTVARYGQTIQGMESGPIHLTNVDLDTGRATLAGEYSLADATYSQLLDKLADQNFRNVSSALRDDILNFYAHAQAPPKEPKRWMKTQDEVSRLQAYAPAAVPTQAK